MGIRKKATLQKSRMPLCAILLLICTAAIIFQNVWNFQAYVPIIIICTLFLSIIYGEIRPVFSTLWLWCLAYCFVLISVLNSINVHSSLIWTVVFTVGLVWLFSNYSERYYLILINMCMILALLFAFSIYLNVLIPDLMTNYLSFLVPDTSLKVLNSEINQGIYSGFLAERGYAAVAMNIGIAAAMTKLCVECKNTVLYTLVIGVYILAIFLTGKRSLTLIAITVTILVFFLYRAKGKQKKILTVVVVALVIFTIAFSAIPEVSVVFERFTQQSEKGDVLSNRDTLLWPKALAMYHESPAFGLGINSYNTYCQTRASFQWEYHAHSTYIQLLGEMGIVGCVMFCIIFIVTLIKTIAIIRNKFVLENPILSKLVIFSLYIQLFWLIYGLSGNPFYYFGQLLLYILACSIMLSVEYKIKHLTSLKSRYVNGGSYV